MGEKEIKCLYKKILPSSKETALSFFMHRRGCYNGCEGKDTSRECYVVDKEKFREQIEKRLIDKSKLSILVR